MTSPMDNEPTRADIITKRNALAIWAEVVRGRAKRCNIYSPSDAAQIALDAKKLADLVDELLAMERVLFSDRLEAERWRPIAEAPRDGRTIIGLGKDGTVEAMLWSLNHNGEDAWVCFGGAFRSGFITHFMPLPEGPILPTLSSVLKDKEG